jgi:hypothetical protein
MSNLKSRLNEISKRMMPPRNLNLALRLPPAPTGPIDIPTGAGAAAVSSPLRDELARLKRGMTDAAYLLLIRDFGAHLRGQEFSRGGTGLGSLLEAYVTTHGSIDSSSKADAFIEWLLKPATLSALRYRSEAELVLALHSVYYAEGASSMGVRLAKSKYTGGASRRRTRGSRVNRGTRRRRASRRH